MTLLFPLYNVGTWRIKPRKTHMASFLFGVLFLDDFFGDVEFFHVSPEHEASLGIKGSNGLIQNRGDRHEDPLKKHEDFFAFTISGRTRWQNAERNHDRDDEADGGKSFNYTYDIRQVIAYHGMSGKIHNHWHPATEGDNWSHDGERDVSI